MARVRVDQHVIDYRNRLKAQLLAAKIAEAVSRGAGKGLAALRPFLVSRIKEELSVPAPRKRVKDTLGNIYYRATTRATRGAPPRKLSSRLRTSVAGLMVTKTKLVVGTNARANPNKRGERFNYPRYHELQLPQYKGSGQHPFITPTVRKYRKEIKDIVGKNIQLELR